MSLPVYSQFLLSRLDCESKRHYCVYLDFMKNILS